MRIKFVQNAIDKIRGKKRKPMPMDWFKQCYDEYIALDVQKRFSVRPYDFWVCLGDNVPNTGFDCHYEYHQAWAARCLKEINPKKHIDISSRITFNVVASAFYPIEFYDFRPAQIYNLSGLECKQADLTKLDFADNSVESLSCMHTVEHIGLGRYGDAIDPEGDLKAIDELKRVLRGGAISCLSFQ